MSASRGNASLRDPGRHCSWEVSSAPSVSSRVSSRVDRSRARLRDRGGGGGNRRLRDLGGHLVRQRVIGERWLALSGGLSIVFGRLFITPVAGVLTLALWVGAYAIASAPGFSRWRFDPAVGAPRSARLWLAPPRPEMPDTA